MAGAGFELGNLASARKIASVMICTRAQRQAPRMHTNYRALRYVLFLKEGVRAVER